MTTEIETEPEAQGQTRIQSASRAMRILLAVATSADGLQAKEVARQFGLSLPTAYHLLNTLDSEGMLFKDERRRYLIGPKASVIADAFNRSNTVPERYIKSLHYLADTTGETAYLSAWRRGEIVVLATVEGSQAVRVVGLTEGYSENIHARASGKLLLAYAPEEIREQAVKSLVLRRLTDATITSRAALRRELDGVRAEGIAFDRQEFREGVECVSAPIRDEGKVVACFTVSTPAARFAKESTRITEVLRRAAGMASSD